MALLNGTGNVGTLINEGVEAGAAHGTSIGDRHDGKTQERKRQDGAHSGSAHFGSARGGGEAADGGASGEGGRRG